MKERIQKILANAGVASRRSVEELIRQGRVAVNGRIVKELPILIDPAIDKVKVDDEPIKLAEAVQAERLYYLMNKPKDVYSTNVAQGAQTRAVDLLPPGIPARLYPVGRLDADSTGLLLLTNDGELTNQLTHPSFGVPKTYRAIVAGSVSEESLDEMEKGIWLADKSGKGFKTGRTHIKVIKRLKDRSGNAKTILEVNLREGRNRQVRRMLAKIGHKVRELTRIKMGPLTLGNLGPGEVRKLTPREVRELLQFASRKPMTGPGEGAHDHRSTPGTRSRKTPRRRPV